MDDINYSTIELDLNDFSKENLIALILLAESWNLTFNETIVRVISDFVSRHETKEISTDYPAIVD